MSLALTITRQRIAVSIYVDHQDVIMYPLEYICSRLSWAEEVWIHAGDDVTHALVKMGCEKFTNVHFHVVNHKIVEPQDIAIGRTKCFEWLRNNTTCDWFVALSADTLPTDMGAVYIVNLCDANPRDPISISTHMICLYVDAGWSHWGCTVFHRSFVQEWAEDGSYFKNSAGMEGTRLAMCIHLGYLGTDALGRHLTQHTKTWRSDNTGPVNDYNIRSRNEFIERRLLDIRENRPMAGHSGSPHISGLIFFDEPEFFATDATGQLPYREVATHLSEEYKRAVTHLGLTDDMNNVRNIANRIGRNRQM